MSSLFLLAARQKYRFPSIRGELTAEQLFDLPLTSKSGFDLNSTAKAINSALKDVTTDSFVETISDPRKPELTAKLEIVKEVIAIKQAENAAAADKAKRAEKRAKILDAIAAAETRELSKASVDELRKQLDELG